MRFCYSFTTQLSTVPGSSLSVNSVLQLTIIAACGYIVSLVLHLGSTSTLMHEPHGAVRLHSSFLDHSQATKGGTSSSMQSGRIHRQISIKYRFEVAPRASTPLRIV